MTGNHKGLYSTINGMLPPVLHMYYVYTFIYQAFLCDLSQYIVKLVRDKILLWTKILARIINILHRCICLSILASSFKRMTMIHRVTKKILLARASRFLSTVGAKDNQLISEPKTFNLCLVIPLHYYYFSCIKDIIFLNKD